MPTNRPAGQPTGQPTGQPGGGAALPRPRGDLTAALFTALRRDPHRSTAVPPVLVDEADEDDLQLALYCCYELHYGGFPDVADDWEWEPGLLACRRRMEGRMEQDLRVLAGPLDVAPDAVVPELRRLAAGGDGPSLSAWVADHGTRWHLRELSVHRSAYQLKEADPHTWAIPRLAGEAKAAMVAIQAAEYGDGVAARSHAALFSGTMQELGLDPAPNAYLDTLPAETLRSTNAVSLFGLHRRLRGALVGHLALFEMTSVVPMARYAAALGRLGLPPAARQFFEVHVDADAVHQELATDVLVAGLLAAEPRLAADVVLGARALHAVEARFTARLLTCWRSGRTSLRVSPAS